MCEETIGVHIIITVFSDDASVVACKTHATCDMAVPSSCMSLKTQRSPYKQHQPHRRVRDTSYAPHLHLHPLSHAGTDWPMKISFGSLASVA